MATKKRLQKKQHKQKVTEKLKQKGYTEKEIKKLPKQEVKKASSQVRQYERKQQRRQQNRDFIRKNNLTETYKYNGVEYKGASRLADLSPDVLKEFARLQKNRERDRALKNKKVEQIINAGYSREFAEKYKKANLKTVSEVAFKGDRTVYYSKQHLSVSWADVTGESHWAMALESFNHLSTKEMISKIHDIYKASKRNETIDEDGEIVRGDSSGFKGVAKISVSDSAGKIFGKAQKAISRGYDNLMVTEDTTLLSTNKFTVRGYANMMLSVMTRTKPALVQNYYEEFENFAYNNLPEIHKEIFR